MINLGLYSSGEFAALRFRPTLTDRLLEGVVALLLLFTLLLLFVPRFGVSEAVDAAGRLRALCFSGALLLLGSCAYLPMRFFNLPVRITAANAFLQLRLAVRLCRLLNVLMALLNISLLLAFVSPVGRLLAAVFGCLMALLFIGYLGVAFRNRG